MHSNDSEISTSTSLVKPTTEELVKVLEDVRLGYLLPRFGLNSTYEWSSILSLGEQQRLAFARLLLAKPYLILLDESTSALDEDNEVAIFITFFFVWIRSCKILRTVILEPELIFFRP